MVRLDNERLKARKAVESLYDCTCRIYGYTNGYDSEKHCVTTEEVLFAEDVPCKLSYSSKQSASQSSTVDILGQDIFLYLAPEIRCRAGAKVEVTQNDVVRTYDCAGLSALYYTHQEVRLRLADTEA